MNIQSRRRVRLLALATAFTLSVATLTSTLSPAIAAPQAPQAAPAVPAAVHTTATTLTNRAHLDFLLDETTAAPVEGHTTYRLAEEPTLVLPWTMIRRPR